MYEIENQKILTWSLEYHIVDHCNLRCRQCASFSPHLATRKIHPEQFEADLELAKLALTPQLLRLSGGEPLLHPQLVTLLKIAKTSAIAPRIALNTNGFLLEKADQKFWKLIDQLNVSLYSSAPLSTPILAWIEEQAKQNKIHLNFKKIHEFQDLTPENFPLEEKEANLSFMDCWMKNRCHTLDRGYFYTCTRPPHLGQLLGRETFSDGISLKGPDLKNRIFEYLTRQLPLESCHYCLGNRGLFNEHTQLENPTKGIIFS